MRAGRIHEDFFYRLCGDQVNTVALHEILASRPDEIIGSVHYICSRFLARREPGNFSSRVVDTLREQVPKNYEWPGNFSRIEQAVRNVIVLRTNTLRSARGEESNRIETVYENTEVSLALEA